MLEVLIIGLVAILGAAAQNIVGFGYGVLVTPFLLFFLKPPAAVALTLLSANIVCIATLLGERKKLSIAWPVVFGFVVPALPGSLVGALILSHLNKASLQIIIGVLIVVSIVIQEYIFPKPTKKLIASPSIIASGFLSGLSNAMAAMSAPPLILWLRSHLINKSQMRHILAATFLFTNSTSLVVVMLLNPSTIGKRELLLLTVLVPTIGFGYWFSRFIAYRLDQKYYRAVVFYAVIAAGLATFIAGLVSL